MKKKIKFLCVLSCLALICSLTLVNVNAEELPEEPIVEENGSIIGQTYTYVEDKNYTFTILDETQVEVIATDKIDETQSITVIMQYTYIDGILTISMLDEVIGEFVIEENNTLSIYAPPKVEEQEIEEPKVEEPEIVYPCSVSLSYIENGIITFSHTEGNVGDLIEVYITPDLLYDLVELKVNGVDLVADEYGMYSFVLVEGINVVSARFEVSDAKLEQVADLLNKVKEGSWEEIFTVSNLMQLISWLITLGCSSGFFVTLYKSRKYKQITPQEIAKKVDEKLDEVLDDKLTNFLKDTFGPFNENMLQKFSSMENSTKTMVRCFILMQENTPESRIAILKELDNLNKEETGVLALQVKSLIAEEVKKQEADNKALSQTIEDLKNETSSTVTHV